MVTFDNDFKVTWIVQSEERYERVPKHSVHDPWGETRLCTPHYKRKQK